MQSVSMKLSTWAKKQGISYRTAYRWFTEGKMPVEYEPMSTGTIIVKDETVPVGKILVN
jgi:predicted site-specific integrase-resolvase